MKYVQFSEKCSYLTEGRKMTMCRRRRANNLNKHFREDDDDAENYNQIVSVTILESPSPLVRN